MAIKSPSQRPTPFSLQRPNGGKWVLYVLLFVVLNLGMIAFQTLWMWFAFVMVLDILLVPPLWGRASLHILRNSVFLSLQGKAKGMTRVFNLFIGLHVSKDRTFFLEGRMPERNLNRVGATLKGQVFDVITTAFGFTFLVAVGIKYLFGTYLPDPTMLFGITFVLLFCSPFLFFWLLPIFWVLRDANIRAVDEVFNVSNIGEEMKGGFLGTFLGVAGLLAALGFFTDLGPEYWGNYLQSPTTIQVYILSIVWISILVMSIGGTATLTTLLYLSLYHEKNVNAVRAELAGVLRVRFTNLGDKAA